MVDSSLPPTPGRDCATFAPALTHFTDEVLFGQMWARPGLTPAKRSLVTVASLVTLGDSAELAYHLELARANGVSTAELVEAITHLAFYAGWPKATAAMGVARSRLGSANGARP
jgi:4-carboxymuconolactone decarboxylase